MQLRLMWVKTKLHRVNNGANSILPESIFYQMVPFIRLWLKAGWRPLQTGSCGQSKDCPALPHHRALETSNPAFSLIPGGLWCYYHKIHTPTLAYSFVLVFSDPVTDTIFITFHWRWRPSTLDLLAFALFTTMGPSESPARNVQSLYWQQLPIRNLRPRTFFLVSYSSSSIRIGSELYIYFLVAALSWEEIGI